MCFSVQIKTNHTLEKIFFIHFIEDWNWELTPKVLKKKMIIKPIKKKSQ